MPCESCGLPNAGIAKSIFHNNYLIKLYYEIACDYFNNEILLLATLRAKREL
jgi:hypothetical protein